MASSFLSIGLWSDCCFLLLRCSFLWSLDFVMAYLVTAASINLKRRSSYPINSKRTNVKFWLRINCLNKIMCKFSPSRNHVIWTTFEFWSSKYIIHSLSRMIRTLWITWSWYKTENHPTTSTYNFRYYSLITYEDGMVIPECLRAKT